MSMQAKWKQDLNPWAARYGSLVGDIGVLCRESTDEELEELRVTAAMATTTNCGWSTYGAARLLESEVRSEVYRRERARKEAAATETSPA